MFSEYIEYIDSDEKSVIFESKSCKSYFSPLFYLLCSIFFGDNLDSHYCHGMPSVLKISSRELFY